MCVLSVVYLILADAKRMWLRFRDGQFFPFFLRLHTRAFRTKQIRLSFEKNKQIDMCDFVHNKIPFLFSPFNIMIFARNVAQPTAIFDILYLYICWWWFHIPVCHLRCSFDQYQWSICWHCLLFNTRGRSQRPVPSTSSIETGTVDAWTHTGPAFRGSSLFPLPHTFPTALKWFGAISS